MNILGSTVDVKISSGETDGKYYVFHISIPAGGEIPAHVHADEDEIVTVIGGELEVMTDNQTRILRIGDVGNLPRNIPHGLRNSGNEECKSIVVVSPGTGFEKFFGELSVLSDAAEVDMNEVVALLGKYGMQLS